MKKGQTGKTMMITFCLDIQDSKTVFKYEIRPEKQLFTLSIFSVNIFLISENSLKIWKKG